jgi:hypothetical protein
MPGEDPRARPAPLSEVPVHLAEGAALYNAGEFWRAHEAWERAWHSLRAAGQEEAADYVQALVWVTASFENLRRGKPEGHRRQLAKAVRRLRALHGAGQRLGLQGEEAFLAALGRIGACLPEAASLAALPEPPPRLVIHAP